MVGKLYEKSDHKEEILGMLQLAKSSVGSGVVEIPRMKYLQSFITVRKVQCTWNYVYRLYMDLEKAYAGIK